MGVWDAVEGYGAGVWGAVGGELVEGEGGGRDGGTYGSSEREGRALLFSAMMVLREREGGLMAAGAPRRRLL